MSYPLRVRGLKLLDGDEKRTDSCRILYGYVGWNCKDIQFQKIGKVVSFTGTWVETMLYETMTVRQRSYPLRVRGLKPGYHGFLRLTLMSYPLRVRGLKPDSSYKGKNFLLSYPLRVRGLKQYRNSNLVINGEVVSFTGTWVETKNSSWYIAGPIRSYPLRVRGLKP